MLKLKVKNKIVNVNHYSSYSSYAQSSGNEELDITYHLYLNKKGASVFNVGDKVSIVNADLPSSFELKVKSISRLEDNSFCVELIHKVKHHQELEHKEADCKLDNDCDCDCCSCEKETSKDDTVDSIQAMVDRVLSQEDLNKMPKHFIGIFSDGNKDTVAFELKDGRMENIGVAHRHSADTFDFHTGADIAYARCTGADVPAEHQHCTCDECDGGCDQEDHIWLHDDDDTPLMDLRGRALKLGDYVIGHTSNGGYVPGVIGHSNGNFYLCNEQGPAIKLEEFTDFDLVWRG